MQSGMLKELHLYGVHEVKFKQWEWMSSSVFGDLVDIRSLSADGQDIYIRMASSEIGKYSDHSMAKSIIIITIEEALIRNYFNYITDSRVLEKRILIASLTSATGIILLALSLILCIRKMNKDSTEGEQGGKYSESEHEESEITFFKLATILKATDCFSIENKLGEGGFGPVYKGMLEGGQEIAVKRLSRTSTQGLDEFKNEVIFIAKLQHRNLVRLLGCCMQKDENMGLLYLHQDSRLRIIHRDLKASNVLLDSDMNPKISDFGTARRFRDDETEAKTRRVVGTYGYMSPEYAVDGIFSIKSDVFSFGVLVLEIVSGKSNRGFSHKDHHLNLLGHQNPEDRPSISSVVLMLGNEGVLPEAKQPGFYTEREPIVSQNSTTTHATNSPNELTITMLDAR
ncbi:hypothetical protein F511_04684 [Dorcoceras hygrometricum]|uniref:non-specific serine/threonine protein kinase n=1 Tax=Dorcoceras hygrometricum TaxID=472368 RepID=A0A2Z7AZA9_9LAMI|nr:hypothetical protein F511_04684 [Dorcoceras hygrometricum]